MKTVVLKPGLLLVHIYQLYSWVSLGEGRRVGLTLKTMFGVDVLTNNYLQLSEERHILYLAVLGRNM